ELVVWRGGAAGLSSSCQPDVHSYRDLVWCPEKTRNFGTGFHAHSVRVFAKHHTRRALFQRRSFMKRKPDGKMHRAGRVLVQAGRVTSPSPSTTTTSRR